MAATGAGLAAALVWAVRGYRRDLREATLRLDAVERTIVPTRFGAVEYATRGTGEPLLVSHGIFQGCDGALLSTRDLIRGRRVIAPSRFGYLGSAMPPAATPADQADAFVELLDHLGLDRIDVIGASAGATAALQFGLRHTSRTNHLVIVSGNLPGGRTAVAQPPWVELLYSDGPMWTLKVIAPALLARLAGVPPGFPSNPDEERFVSEFLDSLFPIAARAEGIAFDAFISNPDVNRYPLERLTVPTLLIHAKDDPLASYDSSARAAERIPGSILVTLESGGHLGLGQNERMRTEVGSFLADRVAVRARTAGPA
jgi:pimeloyl-ACP methyl ester carboxylesterase